MCKEKKHTFKNNTNIGQTHARMAANENIKKWNVKLTLWYSVITSLADAISSIVVSNYLYDLTGRNFLVGLSEGIQGIVQMIIAIPIGILADKYSKAKMLRYGSFIISFVVAITAIPLILDLFMLRSLFSINANALTPKQIYILITISYVFWGFVSGYISPVLDSIFSNSLENGEQRTIYNNRRYIISVLASSVGPIISLLFFLYFGDNWSRFNLIIVWLTSLLFTIFSIGPLYVFLDVDDKDGSSSDKSSSDRINVNNTEEEKLLTDDKNKLINEGCIGQVIGDDRLVTNNYNNRLTSELITYEPVDQMDQPATDKPLNQPANNTPMNLIIGISNVENKDGKNRNAEDKGIEDKKSNTKDKPNKTWWIPYCCLTSDIVFALGSGATVKFWPIFYMNQVSMTPIELSILYFTQVLLLALMVHMMTILVENKIFRMGRIGWSLITLVLGLALFVLIIIFREQWSNKLLMSILTVLRSVFMNSSSSTLSSVLIDNVPNSERGKWSALNSITSASWCGSALIGGWIIDNYSYGTIFFVTVILQCLGTLVLVPLTF